MQEPEAGRRIVNDNHFTNMQHKRPKLNVMGMFGCLVGMTVPYLKPDQFTGCHNNSIFRSAPPPKRRNPNEPLCLLKADDLSDADGLVRASQEPMQAQEGALLRAASGETQAGQESKAGRRIVSKGEYVKVQAGRAGQALSGSLAVFLGAICGFIALVFVGFFAAAFCGFVRTPYLEILLPALVMLAVAVGFGVGMVHLLRPGFASIRNASENNVIPLTRANTADLPANDSLVRASQEPGQAQKGVLLRAASGEAQTEQEGQLLRASAGGE